MEVEHQRYQLAYYGQVERKAIRPADTPYVRRHFHEVSTAADLATAGQILEVGCGSGRFTRWLLELGPSGGTVVANDLSPFLLDRLRRDHPKERLETLACGVEQLPQQSRRRFDRVVGFFVLHHLYDLDTAFAGLTSVLEPGARVAFCEPNAYCPFFYLQVLLTPAMTWRGEAGLRRMTPRHVLGAMARHGFGDLKVKRYGFLPPALANTAVGQAVEGGLERVGPLRPLRAFQVFSGVKRGETC